MPVPFVGIGDCGCCDDCAGCECLEEVLDCATWKFTVSSLDYTLDGVVWEPSLTGDPAPFVVTRVDPPLSLPVGPGYEFKVEDFAIDPFDYAGAMLPVFSYDFRLICECFDLDGWRGGGGKTHPYSGSGIAFTPATTECDPFKSEADYIVDANGAAIRFHGTWECA